MPTFVAQVRDSRGNTIKQKIAASNLAEARSTLRDQGLFVQDIKQNAGIGSLDLKKIQTSMVSVTIKDKAVFSRQFAALVSAGVAMVRGLGVLSEQCTNPKLKVALTAVSTDIQEGVSLSDAMRKHPECFDNLYVSMIQAGEVGGVLDEVLGRLAKLLEDTARLQNQIKSALAYPVVVGSLATIIFLAMTIFIIPVFAGIFKEIGGDLPAFTQAMLDISEFLRSPKVLILVILVPIIVFSYKR